MMNVKQEKKVKNSKEDQIQAHNAVSLDSPLTSSHSESPESTCFAQDLETCLFLYDL